MWQIPPLLPYFAQYSVMTLDRYDKLILEALQRDGRKSNVQLASVVNLSESACLRRVRALEDSGMIDRYTALVSQPKAGLSGNVFVHIGLHREEQSELAAFEDAVKRIRLPATCCRRRHGRLRANSQGSTDTPAWSGAGQFERDNSNRAETNRIAAALVRAL